MLQMNINKSSMWRVKLEQQLNLQYYGQVKNSSIIN